MYRQFMVFLTGLALSSCHYLEPGDGDFRRAESLEKQGKRAEAIAAYKDSAKAGHRHAPARVAAMYLRAPKDSDDVKEGAKWALKCADAGMAECEELVGLMYWTGLGITPNLDSAKTYLKRAADKGAADAKRWLSDMEAGREPSRAPPTI